MTVQIVPAAKQNNQIEVLKEILKALSLKEVTYSITPPSNPKNGDLWFSLLENRLYIYKE